MTSRPQLDFIPLYRPSGCLSEAERKWVHYQPYLYKKGYQLRPRYRPGWVPSWQLANARNVSPMLCEDSFDCLPFVELDAVRRSDNQQVIIKMILPGRRIREPEEELGILQHFSSLELARAQNKPVINCLESFDIPDVRGGKFVVMPLLIPHTVGQFHHLGELREIINQALLGLMFLHEHRVAHCNIAGCTLMMTPNVFKERMHPQIPQMTADFSRMLPPSRRAEASPQYYWVDFGSAVRMTDTNNRHVVPYRDAVIPVPEHSEATYDPFQADIYQLGALIQINFVKEYRELEFLRSITKRMTEDDPAKRITLKEAYRDINKAFDKQYKHRYIWPIIPRGVTIIQWMGYASIGIKSQFIHYLHTLLRILAWLKG
ncbi:hypothetical protein FRC08_014475 [Ceratobasidium sp. 394]|nr:hypothetical protein FRC08_014475 [Ceratobasidium sp. 394]